MADDANTTIVRSAMLGIEEAWTFFFPRLIRLIILVVFTSALGAGSTIWNICAHFETRFPELNLQYLISFLVQYKLGALIPILAITAAIAIVFIIDRSIMVLSFMLPLRISYSESVLFAWKSKLVPLRFKLAGVNSVSGLLSVIDLELLKAETRGQDALLQNAERWFKKCQEWYFQFMFCKFLMLWGMGWTVYLVITQGHARRRISEFIVFIVLIFVWGFVSMLKYLGAAEQRMHARVTAASVLLFDAGKEELPEDSPETLKLERLIREHRRDHKGWWWLNTVDLHWLKYWRERQKGWNHAARRRNSLLSNLKLPRPSGNESSGTR